MTGVEEDWRDIPEWEGLYQASTLGRIRSRDRKSCKGRVLNGRIDKDGYIKMNFSRDGKARGVFAHRAVATAFLGLPPTALHQSAHYDGNKKNNTPSNLRWATVGENAQDKVRLGLTANQFGERHSHSKLTNGDIYGIRSVQYYRGLDTELSRVYGVTPQTIGKIRRGERWPHLQP